MTRFAGWLRYPLAVLILAVLWQLVYVLGIANPKYFPSIFDVGRAFMDLVENGLLATNAISFSRACFGLCIASLLGIALAILGDIFPVFGKGFGYIADLVQPVPPAALVPMAVFALGLGWKLYAFVIIMVTIWPPYLNGLQALASVSQVQLNAGRMLGCGKWQLLRDIKLPAALPEIFSGIRYAATLAIVSVTVAEMLAGRDGIGFMIFKKAFAMRTADVFALMFVVAINGIALNILVGALRKAVTGWHFGMMERIE